MVNLSSLKVKTHKRLAVQKAVSLFLFSALLSACSEIAVKDLDPDSYGGVIVPPPSGSTVSFATDITPIINSKCGSCHNGSPTQPIFNTSGATLYATVQPIASELLTAVSGSHPSGAGSFIPVQADKTKITTWVSEGAQNN